MLKNILSTIVIFLKLDWLRKKERKIREKSVFCVMKKREVCLGRKDKVSSVWCMQKCQCQSKQFFFSSGITTPWTEEVKIIVRINKFRDRQVPTGASGIFGNRKPISLTPSIYLSICLYHFFLTTLEVGIAYTHASYTKLVGTYVRWKSAFLYVKQGTLFAFQGKREEEKKSSPI